MSDLNLHPEPDQLEAYLEGELADGERATFESHLFACSRCQAELEEWRGLFSALGTLPPIEPSADFADRVMASVHVAAVAARARTRHWIPRTTKGWALLAAALGLPAAGIGSALAWLLAQPWASSGRAGTLVVYAWSALATGMTWLLGQATALVMDTGLARLLSAVLGQLVSKTGPLGLGLAAAACCLVMLASVWILYRNLIRTSTRNAQYAPYTI